MNSLRLSRNHPILPPMNYILPTIVLSLLSAPLLISTAVAHSATDPVPRTDGGWKDRQALLNKRAAETELRLKRLYDAIEAGVADLDDPALKDRIDGLRALRDQAKVDSERAQAMLLDYVPPNANSRPHVDLVPVRFDALEDFPHQRSEAPVIGDQGVVDIEEDVHGA